MVMMTAIMAVMTVVMVTLLLLPTPMLMLAPTVQACVAQEASQEGQAKEDYNCDMGDCDGDDHAGAVDPGHPEFLLITLNTSNIGLLL
jgi:hypothetical protein